MHRFVKEFIENNVDLLDQQNYKQFYINAYDEALTTADMQQINEMLLEANIFDSTELRNELLYAYVDENIKHIKKKYKNKDLMDRTVVDSYLVQFLRVYLNNCFGFTQKEAIEFVYNNQLNFGITLVPVDTFGQAGIENYMIEFNS